LSIKIEADCILLNGRIWRGRAEGTCQALAIWQGKVIASGSDDDILSLKGAETQVIDLQGQFACPGLNDNHLHLLSTGLVMGMVNVTPDAVPTLAAMKAAIAERVAQTPKGGWVLARGYDQVKLDTGVHPTRADLDAVAPDHPVLVTRACGHIAIANSRALELGGVTEATPVPEGSVIGMTGNRLNGLLAENAIGLVRRAIPALSEDQLVDAIEAGGKHLLSFGITSCMDAAVGQIGGLGEIRAYEIAKLTGRLPVRVWLTLMGDPGRSIVDECHAMGLVTGAGDDMLRIGGVKLFLDGSAGGRTAWVSKPYRDEPDNLGVQMLPTDQVEALVQDFHDRGYQMACHAIGDAAIEQIITAYEKALAKTPAPDRRHRIEHCGFLAPDHNARMKAAGIYPAGQQAFIHDFGDSYIAVMDEERALSSYPAGTWMRMGMKPSTGSDSPVCSPNPFPDFHSMVTRQTWRGTVMDANECLTREEALQAYTEFGAYSQSAETVKGRLVPGQWADIAVFDNDLLQAPLDTIKTGTRCVLTLLGGRVVHDAR